MSTTWKLLVGHKPATKPAAMTELFLLSVAKVILTCTSGTERKPRLWSDQTLKTVPPVSFTRPDSEE